MDLGKAIKSLLVAAPSVNNTVSGRIFPDMVPQETAFPLIAYTIINEDPTKIKGAVSPLDTVAVQIDIYSQSYETTQALNDAVRSTLDKFRGTQNGVVIDGFDFQATGAGRYDEKLNVFWVSQDYNVRINRA